LQFFEVTPLHITYIAVSVEQEYKWAFRTSKSQLYQHMYVAQTNNTRSYSQLIEGTILHTRYKGTVLHTRYIPVSIKQGYKWACTMSKSQLYQHMSTVQTNNPTLQTCCLSGPIEIGPCNNGALRNQIHKYYLQLIEGTT
jgi:hypothetical protein